MLCVYGTVSALGAVVAVDGDRLAPGDEKDDGMKKLLIVGGGLLVGLVTATMITLYMSLGTIVSGMVETHGSDMLGTAVTVEHVEIKQFEGYLSLQGLAIKNPRGFKAESIFTLAEMTVRLDVATVREELIQVHLLSLIEPKIYYELEFPEGNNLATLGRNIDAYNARTGGDEAAPVDEAPADTEDGGPRLIIKQFEMLGAQVRSGTNVQSPVLSKFPDFRIQNIGADSGGATPADVAKYILGVISKRMVGF